MRPIESRLVFFLTYPVYFLTDALFRTRPEHSDLRVLGSLFLIDRQLYPKMGNNNRFLILQGEVVRKDRILFDLVQCRAFSLKDVDNLGRN